jgi:DNA-binding transcriptional LysR family regulator
MRVIRARDTAQPAATRSADFYQRGWVLNPAGCLVREEIGNRVRRLGGPLVVAAELHNPELQLALVAGNIGAGVARASVLRKHPLRSRLQIVRHPRFEISVRIALVRARHLGAREPVALELQRLLTSHFKRDQATGI